MATKASDPCREKAADDEPIFTLRAQDVLAPRTVRHWAELAHARGVPASKVAEARALADQMSAWQKANRWKVPD